MPERLKKYHQAMQVPDTEGSTDLIERARMFRPLGLILEKIQLLNDLAAFFRDPERLAIGSSELAARVARLLPRDADRYQSDKQLLFDAVATVGNQEKTGAEIDQTIQKITLMKYEYEVLVGQMMLALEGSFLPGQIVTDSNDQLLCVISVDEPTTNDNEQFVQDIRVCDMHGTIRVFRSDALMITDDETDYDYFLQQLRQNWHEFGSLLDLEEHMRLHYRSLAPEIAQNQPLFELQKLGSLLRVRRGQA